MTSAREISVFVNAKPHSLPQASTLAALVAELTCTPHNLATALNGDFVPRSQREARVLRDGDHISCFQLIAGG